MLLQYIAENSIERYYRRLNLYCDRGGAWVPFELTDIDEVWF